MNLSFFEKCKYRLSHGQNIAFLLFTRWYDILDPRLGLIHAFRVLGWNDVWIALILQIFAFLQRKQSLTLPSFF